MRALVTGGAGFIGSHLVDALVECGWEVTVLDALVPPCHRGGLPQWANPRARYVIDSVCNAPAVAEALDGVHTVFHLAAVGGFDGSILDPITSIVTGTATLMECIGQRRDQIKKMVFASSQGVYGESRYRCPEHGSIRVERRSQQRLRAGLWEAVCPQCGAEVAKARTREVDEARPDTPYTAAKLAKERLLLTRDFSAAVPVVGLRLALTYGPRQSLSNPYTGLLSIFATLCKNVVRPRVFEDGRQQRNLLYVSDAVQAFLLAAAREDPSGVLWNVAGNTCVEVLDLATRVARGMRAGVDPLVTGEFRVGDVRHLELDTTRIRSAGFEPQVDLNEGLERFLKWFQTQPTAASLYLEAAARGRDLKIIRSSGA